MKNTKNFSNANIFQENNSIVINKNDSFIVETANINNIDECKRIINDQKAVIRVCMKEIEELKSKIKYNGNKDVENISNAAKIDRALEIVRKLKKIDDSATVDRLKMENIKYKNIISKLQHKLNKK